jgi:hypothetical protein
VYHAHQLNLLGNNRFALFDNGRMNTFSSTVVIKVDEEEQQAYLEFRYGYPHSNYQPAMGGVLRTPTGSFLASLGYGCFLNEFNTVQPGNASIVEVTPEKQKVWEMHFAPGEKHGWMYYRVERFYSNPLIQANHTTLKCEHCEIHVQVWNSYYSIHPCPGRVYVATKAGYVLHTEAIVFVPYWQQTDVRIGLPCIDYGTHVLIVAVENEAGYSAHVSFTIQSTSRHCRNPCLNKW